MHQKTDVSIFESKFRNHQRQAHCCCPYSVLAFALEG